MAGAHVGSQKGCFFYGVVEWLVNREKKLQYYHTVRVLQVSLPSNAATCLRHSQVGSIQGRVARVVDCGGGGPAVVAAGGRGAFVVVFVGADADAAVK
jgi:hypothetical protein